MKKILSLLIMFLFIISLSACGNDGKLTDEPDMSDINISETDLFGVTEVQAEEELQLLDFSAKISASFSDKKLNDFTSLINGDTIAWIVLYGGEEYVESASAKPVSELFFSEGRLMQKSPEINPPEVDLDLSSDVFRDSVFEFRYADEKDGFLENIDWSIADCDFMQAHFHAYYDEMAWIVDRPTNENGWTIYKLSNNTYILTNGVGWYDEAWSARVFAGKVFVIKRDGDNFGIVAYIDAK